MNIETHPDTSAFTLVEIAIVITIVALLIGGILVGRDVIQNAEVRSTISQVGVFNGAATAFLDKYRNYPGDVESSMARRFGFEPRSGLNGHGDGDRVLEGCSSSSGGTISGLLFGCENALFWRDLNQVGLINDNFVLAADSPPDSIINAGDMTNWLPSANAGVGNYFVMMSASGTNFFQISGITSISTTSDYTLENSLSPQTAFNIDDKVDDGDPYIGRIVARGTTTQLNGAASAGTNTGDCINSALNAYNTASFIKAESPACQLRIFTSF